MGKALAWVIIAFIAIGMISNWINGKPPTTQPARATQVQATSVPPPASPAKPANAWRVQTASSAMDDTKTVHLQLLSDTQIPGRFTGYGPATLHLRCLENTTSAAFSFNGKFLADIQGYGDITYRIDNKQAVKKAFDESTNNEWLGLWRGGTSIPFIKGLLGGEKMVVRATPFNENSVEVTFSIADLQEVIAPLRSACGW